jgi:hypothetical protein
MVGARINRGFFPQRFPQPNGKFPALRCLLNAGRLVPAGRLSGGNPLFYKGLMGISMAA